MARTRNSSLEPERRALSVSRQSPETAPRTSGRVRASPGPNATTRKTMFRPNQPTPVHQQIASTRASPPQQQQAKRVVKRTGRTGRTGRAGSKRTGSLESDGRRSSVGSENEEVLIVEKEIVGRGLPLVPEVDEEPTFSASKFSPIQATSRKQQQPYLPLAPPSNGSDSPSRYSTPGETGTQLELEDTDMDLMLETFSDLDSNAQKLLDLLILHPPVEDLLRDLRIPGSKTSKRLRVYEQSFNASKTAYGTSQYLSSHVVEVALGSSTFNPFIHKANLAVLAKFTHTAQEISDSTFQSLKEIERGFPSQFGGVVHQKNFQAALDLRTQTLILGLKGQQAPNLDPWPFLEHFFMIANNQSTNTSSDHALTGEIKPWVGVEHVRGWKEQVLKRIAMIRSTFSGRGGEDEETVDFDELVRLFPWDGFVSRMADYIQIRLVEIKESRGTTSIVDLVDAVRNDMTLPAERSLAVAAEKGKSVSVELNEKTIPSSTLEQPSGAQTPDDDVEQLPTPKENKETEYPQLLTLPEAAEPIQEQLRIEEMESLNKSKKKLAQKGHGLASIALNMAQIRELKRRKTESFLQRKPEVQGTPRMTASLGAQDSVAINLAQVKLLKIMKSQLGSKPTQPKPQQQVPQDDSSYSNNHHNDNNTDEDPDVSQELPTSSARGIFEQLQVLKKDKNKENDGALALTLPPPISPPRGMKRKRFLDHQENATRVSRIEDDITIESSPKRQQVAKGKGRPLPVAEDEKEQQQTGSRQGSLKLRPIDKGKGRAPTPVEHEEGQEHSLFRLEGDEEEDKDEDEDEGEAEEEPIFEHDIRAVNEERLKKSRQGLSSTGSASTSARTSNPSVRRPSNQSNKSDHVQRQTIRHRGSRQDTPIIVDSSEDDVEDNEKSNLAVERVNRIVKASHIPHPKLKRQLTRKTKTPWDPEESQLLIEKIGELGCRWAAMRDMRIFRRTDVQLKDKARNLKFEYLKARIPLPHNFHLVTISKKQLDILEEMGIELEDRPREEEEEEEEEEG